MLAANTHEEAVQKAGKEADDEEGMKRHRLVYYEAELQVVLQVADMYLLLHVRPVTAKYVPPSVVGRHPRAVLGGSVPQVPANGHLCGRTFSP